MPIPRPSCPGPSSLSTAINCPIILVLGCFSPETTRPDLKLSWTASGIISQGIPTIADIGPFDPDEHLDSDEPSNSFEASGFDFGVSLREEITYGLVLPIPRKLDYIYV